MQEKMVEGDFDGIEQWGWIFDAVAMETSDKWWYYYLMERWRRSEMLPWLPGQCDVGLASWLTN